MRAFRLLQPWFLRLALLAVLLPALLPAAGRLLGEGSPTISRLVALCTVAGIRYVDPASLGDDGKPLPPAVADCDYCLLLGQCLPAPPALLAILPPAAVALPVAGAGVDHTRCCRIGLGSRGPPVVV